MSTTALSVKLKALFSATNPWQRFFAYFAMGWVGCMLGFGIAYLIWHQANVFWLSLGGLLFAALFATFSTLATAKCN